MRFPLLVLLLALPGALRADDPPFLAAAKGRQAKAKAFEVTLSVTTECKNLRPFGSVERKDFTGTGWAKLVVDGEKFWYSVDVPLFDPQRKELTRRREERAFDGARVFSRNLAPIFTNSTPIIPGGRTIPSIASCHIFEYREVSEWGDPFLPLDWAFRGVPTLFSPEGRPNAPHSWVSADKATGREERIGDRPCVEVAFSNPYAGLRSKPESFWFDAERGHLPRQVRGILIGTGPHPTLGWVPHDWTSRTEPVQRQADGTDVVGAVTTTVTMDSFELRDAIPAERFMVTFPVRSRVNRHSENAVHYHVVADDGSLVPVTDYKPAPKPKSPPPAPTEPPSLSRTLAVVGGTAAVFVGLVMLLRRLARGPKPASDPPA